jgi:hypothetical protein
VAVLHELKRFHLLLKIESVASQNKKDVQMASYTNVSSVARDVCVHPNFIYREIAEGRLPAIKFGAPGSKRPTIRIPIVAFEAWKASLLAQGQK